MYQDEQMKIRIAILDLYDGQPNQGMRCLREIIRDWSRSNNFEVELHEFDVRQKCEVPDLSYDIYISSGGPGSPLESEGLEWDNKFCSWIRNVEKWNDTDSNFPRKHVFFICHS